MMNESICATGLVRLLGRRFYKAGDHSRIWIVSAIEPKTATRPPFAILISQDELQVEDVDASHLENADLYAPAP